jgi:hypothetical protein
MEIFNCTNHAMTIEKNSILGIIEKLKDEDQVGELQINEMTVNLEQKELTPAAKIKEKKKKYILDNVKFTRNEELTEALKQKYIALLLEHHEAISNSLFDTGLHGCLGIGVRVGATLDPSPVGHPACHGGPGWTPDGARRLCLPPGQEGRGNGRPHGSVQGRLV